MIPATLPQALLSAALVEIALDAAGKPPTEFRIFRAGINETLDGQFIYDAQAAADVMKLSAQWKGKHDRPYSLDYEHGTFAAFKLDHAESSKSAGWYNIENRDTPAGPELWATDVKWTPRGESYLSSREYRFVSPAFKHTPEKRITRLLNVALTNVPQLNNQQPLMAASLASEDPTPSENAMDPKTLIALLSLGPTATEQDILTALSAQHQSNMQLLALCGASSFSEALGKVKAWSEKATQVDVLTTKLSAIETESKTAKVKGMLDAAVAAKKVSPTQVALLSVQGEKDPEFLKAYLDTLTPMVPTKGARAPVTPADTDAEAEQTSKLSAADEAVARQMGNDTAKLAALKAKLGGVKYGSTTADEADDE